MVLDLRMPVRHTVAHERVDAVRGCVAVERGPLVYCLEQADHPSDVLVDAIRLVGEGTAVWKPDLLEGVTVIEMTGRTAPNRAPLYQAKTADTGQPGNSVRLTAIPYFAWANRGPGPMRVWIPLEVSSGRARRVTLCVPDTVVRRSPGLFRPGRGRGRCCSCPRLRPRWAWPAARPRDRHQGDRARLRDNATGVVQFWDRNTTAPFGKLIVNRFNATHKNLKVVLTPVQDTQYVTKLATAIRAGSPPDLVGIDDINSQLFIYHNVFTDLTPLVNALPEKNQAQPRRAEPDHREWPLLRHPLRRRHVGALVQQDAFPAGRP